MPGKISDPWLGFLWELPRPTGDVDFIEIRPSNAGGELLQIAGEGSEFARTHSISTV